MFQDIYPYIDNKATPTTTKRKSTNLAEGLQTQLKQSSCAIWTLDLSAQLMVPS